MVVVVKLDLKNRFQLFTKDQVSKFRDDVFELDNKERDMLVMGFLMANKPNNGDKSNFFLYGQRVCRTTFLFCFALSLKLYATLCKHFQTNGLVPREHGNKRKSPHNSLPIETRQHAETFLVNFAEQNALLLPGRVPHYRDEEARLQLLPSHETRKTIYEKYREASDIVDLPIMGLSTFSEFWRARLPHIVIAKTMSDLCWVCQEGNTKLIRARAKNFEDEDDDYDQVLEEHKKHIVRATEEQRYYRAQCDKAKENAKELIVSSEKFDLFSPKPKCSFKGMAHFSWDFAQQVHYPYNPLQPGPIFFKTPRKCSIFGICNDGVNMQYSYLIDEINSTGKGANTTISYVHHFLENFNLGETDSHLHADNCSGQNKNNAFLHYLMWRIINGFHQKIEYSFMIAGHTKFSCDRCFGAFKKSFRKTHVSSLYDVAKVCDSTKCNISVLVGTHDQKIHVPTYDWTEHFIQKKFKPIENLLEYHHFRMSSDEPGFVYCSKTFDDLPTKICIVEDFRKVSHDLPSVVEPKGFSRQRKEYLYTDIREFCTEETKNITAPDPDHY
ncbi:uncharacterized protein [Clytia hemisphaerica]|uniref:uncharacterized protein n=1 Tax=Clytia hemisphaerica TaxID=252671 RepID=UPI0034D5E67E